MMFGAPGGAGGCGGVGGAGGGAGGEGGGGPGIPHVVPGGPRHQRLSTAGAKSPLRSSHCSAWHPAPKVPLWLAGARGPVP